MLEHVWLSVFIWYELHLFSFHVSFCAVLCCESAKCAPDDETSIQDLYHADLQGDNAHCSYYNAYWRHAKCSENYTLGCSVRILEVNVETEKKLTWSANGKGNYAVNMCRQNSRGDEIVRWREGNIGHRDFRSQRKKPVPCSKSLLILWPTPNI
jgi:hypothetical protein